MTTFSLVVLRTADPQTLLPFYQALGLEFQQERHGSGPLHFSCVMGGVVLEIYPPKKNQTEANVSVPMLGFCVDSLEETLVRLRVIGVESGAIYTTTTDISCTVRDFDGRTVYLTKRMEDSDEGGEGATVVTLG